MIVIVKKHLLVFVIEINKFEYRILSVENDKFWIWEAIIFIDIWISKDIYLSVTKVICLNSVRHHAHLVFFLLPERSFHLDIYAIANDAFIHLSTWWPKFERTPCIHHMRANNMGLVYRNSTKH
jgi:hypothetical protein